MAPGARAEKRWAAATWSDGGRAGSGRGAAAPAGREEDPPGLRAARRRPAGNLVGLFFGRVVVGPDANLTLSTAALLTAGAAAFIYAVGSRVHPLVTATETALYLLSLGALLLCATTDPGVFPRNAHCDEAEASSCAAEMRYATVGTLQVPLKWCYACRIFRPPRAAHCQDCGVCVREWDHHCPWMGQCIGKRNYRFFYAFLLLTTVLCAHTAGWAGHHLYHISIQPISRPSAYGVPGAGKPSRYGGSFGGSEPGGSYSGNAAIAHENRALENLAGSGGSAEFSGGHGGYGGYGLSTGQGEGGYAGGFGGGFEGGHGSSYAGGSAPTKNVVTGSESALDSGWLVSAAMGVLVLALVIMCCVGPLSCYHTGLLLTNRTTNEEMRGLYATNNPFSRGYMRNCQGKLCGPTDPSRVYVEQGGAQELAMLDGNV